MPHLLGFFTHAEVNDHYTFTGMMDRLPLSPHSLSAHALALLYCHPESAE